MIEELLVLADETVFILVFLRKPDSFYKNEIEKLREKGVKVYEQPFVRSLFFNRIAFVCSFFFKNLKNFFQKYSAVIGFKSIWWFLKLDERFFYRANIHAQFATQASLLALMLKEYSKSAISYSFTFHAYDIYFNNKWFSKLVNHSSSAFSISEYNIDYVKHNYSELNVAKLKLSRLGTYIPSLCEGKTTNDEADKTIQLGFISWFVPKKGMFYLLEAMKILKEKKLNIFLTLAGDGPLKHDFLSFIQKNNLQSSIKYLGKINKNQKHDFFCSLDIFVLPAITVPNDQDGIPVVLMEAVSYGLPLITTKVSGIPEICTNHYNGVLVPEKNTGALVNAILELVHDSKKRTKYANNSKKMFKNFNIKTNTVKKAKLMGWYNKDTN